MVFFQDIPHRRPSVNVVLIRETSNEEFHVCVLNSYIDLTALKTIMTPEKVKGRQDKSYQVW